jgi:RNA polymerase sigma-70 factor (ECF subfamily)
VHLAARESEPDTAPTPRVDKLSFEQVYHQHSVFVWKSALRLGVPASNAEDVLQEVFIVVQRRLAEFDGRSAVRSWIFGILLNMVRRYRRGFQRKDARCVSLDLHPDGALGGLSPSDQAEHAERVRLLEKLLGMLDDDKRTLLVLSEIEGWTLREIAEHLGSNTNTVHSRLRVAKRAFEVVYRRWLAQQGEVR